MLLFTIGLFWCIILIAFFFISNNADLSITYPYFLIISFAYWILCFANKFHVNRTIRKWGFRPSYLCFIGLIAVNLQLLADYAFGLAKLPIDFLPEIYKYADICFFSGLIFITVFVLSNYITTDNFRKNRIGQKECLKDKTWLWLYIIAFILFIINIDIVQFLTGQVYIGSGASDAEAGISASMERLFNVFMVILVAIYTKRMLITQVHYSIVQYIKSIPFIFWIIFICYLSLRLLSGDRGPVMYNGLLIFYSYSLVSKNLIKFKFALPMICIGAYIITLMGIIRSRDTTLSYLDKVQSSLTRYNEMSLDRTPTISPFTYELASSFRCNYVGIRDIEENRTGYKFGQYTILTAIGSFPGAKRKYFEPLGFDSSDFSSAEYLTISYNNSRNYTFGIGTSALGEAYLDANIFGVIIAALIIGIIYKKVDNSYLCSGRALSIPILIVILKLSTLSFYLSRSSISLTLGDILNLLIVYFIFNFFIKKLSFLK